jgi:hypothetical protein
VVEATAAFGFILFEGELMMSKTEDKVLTLEEALQEPRVSSVTNAGRALFSDADHVLL